MGVIVVGVDHSDGAGSALRFALEEAKLRGARLRVVQARQFTAFRASAMEAGPRPTLAVELDDLLGSAGQQASHHAACPVTIPVTIVPHRRQG